MSLKIALASLITTLAQQQIKEAVATVIAEKDQAFATFVDQVKTARDKLADAILADDGSAISAAAEEFDGIIDNAAASHAAHVDAQPDLVDAVLAEPTAQAEAKETGGETATATNENPETGEAATGAAAEAA